MDVVRQIGRVPTDMYDKPRIVVQVFDCGQVGGDDGDVYQLKEIEKNTANEEYDRVRKRKEGTGNKEEEEEEDEGEEEDSINPSEGDKQA